MPDNRPNRPAPVWLMFGLMVPPYLWDQAYCPEPGHTDTGRLLLIAFDTTVAGLAAAGVAFAIPGCAKGGTKLLRYIGSSDGKLVGVFDHGRRAGNRRAGALGLQMMLTPWRVS